jgi:hypothetical protein
MSVAPCRTVSVRDASGRSVVLTAISDALGESAGGLEFLDRVLG